MRQPIQTKEATDEMNAMMYIGGRYFMLIHTSLVMLTPLIDMLKSKSVEIKTTSEDRSPPIVFLQGWTLIRVTDV